MQAAEKEGKNPEKELLRLAAMPVLLMVKQRRKKKDERYSGQDADQKTYYDVFTEGYSYTFRRSEDGQSLFLVNYKPNDLAAHNNAMHNGRCFRAQKGTIVSITLSEDYQLFYDICNEEICERNDYRHEDCSPAVALTIESLDEKRQKRSANAWSEEETQTSYQPTKGLTEVLNLAEKYAILDSQLEETRAMQSGAIPYYSIAPVDYERLDRVCYEFRIVKADPNDGQQSTAGKDQQVASPRIDEEVVRIGAAVKIVGNDGREHKAEIMELVRSGEGAPITAMQLLFSDHLDIESIPTVGRLAMVPNPIIRDVQLAAIKKLRTGTAEAHYMDDVFGRHACAGFNDEDMSALDKAQEEKDHSPNDSQMAAIHNGINARDLYLVMGPPGTGKTTVILEWVKFFVGQGKRVLVSSQNNKAVDNVLERLAKEKDIDTIRIGSELKLQQGMIPFLFENRVSGLRKDIAANTEVRIKALDRIERAWAAYERFLKDRVIPHAEELRAAMQTYREAMRKVAAASAEAERIQKEYEGAAREREALDARLTEISQQLWVWDHGNGMGTPEERQRMGRLRITRPQVKAAQEVAADKERSLRLQYNSARNKYQRLYEDTRDYDYEEYQDAIHEILGHEVTTIEPPARDDGNIWGLYDEARSLWMEDDTSYDRMLRIMQNERARVRKLRDVLMEWQLEMVERQNYALEQIVLEQVQLVGATCIGVSSKRRFQNLHFDITIIDESGQILLHNALVPMSVANKVIMLGDHMQIPPTTDDDLIELCDENHVRTEMLRKSLFERLYMDMPDTNKTMLDTQYRMPCQIAQTISDWFYGGKYYSGPNKLRVKSAIPSLSSSPYIIIDTSGVPGRSERRDEGGGSDNALEAEIIGTLVQRLADDPDQKLGEIGVISAYKAQIRLIKRVLSKVVGGAQAAAMAATLDSFQGQERDIILYSFTKSDAHKRPNQNRVGFLKELRRLNVAMSRCKETLIMIGDIEFLQGCRQMNIDEETGERIEQGSELEFSHFIQQMVSDVRKNGELIPYAEFCKRMGVTRRG